MRRLLFTVHPILFAIVFKRAASLWGSSSVNVPSGVVGVVVVIIFFLRKVVSATKIHQISEKQNIFVLFFVKKGEEGWVNAPFF